MQTLLATNATSYHHKGMLATVELYLKPLLAWLTKAIRQSERKETSSLSMKVAITIFVAAELVLLIVGGNSSSPYRMRKSVLTDFRGHEKIKNPRPTTGLEFSATMPKIPSIAHFYFEFSEHNAFMRGT